MVQLPVFQLLQDKEEVIPEIRTDNPRTETPPSTSGAEISIFFLSVTQS